MLSHAVALIGLLVTASGHAMSQPCSSPPVPSLSVRELSQNGAVVISGSRKGLGFVVGWRQGEAWVAVPAHVVFGEGVLPTDMAPHRAGLQISLFGDTSPRKLCDKGPTPPQVPADLAFICVEWAVRPYFSDGVLARGVKIGDELTLVDFRKGQQFRGAVTRTPELGKTAGVKGDIEAEGLAGVEGQSGALTANAGGAVGLYLAHSSTYHILSMPAIRAKAEVAGVPWQLTYSEYYDCTAVRNVCFTVEGNLSPPSVNMKNIYSPGAYPLSPGACAALSEGRYEIIVPPLGLSCEPRSISVYSAAEDLRLALRCSVALMGTWRTEDGDELICIETQIGKARCGGLGRLGMGLFDGAINSRGQDFSIAGFFVDPSGNAQEANGSLRWSGEFLTGEIRRRQEPPKPLKLKRAEDR